MLAGRFILDGVDAYNNYGLYVKDEGLSTLIQMPSFKTVETYDWHEENGVEADLSAPVLNSRQITIAFYITDRDWAEDLIADLSDGSYHEFYFPLLRRTYTLRLASNGTFSNIRGASASQVSLTFVEDTPALPSMPDGMPLPYGSSGVNQNGYEIDSADLSQFGAWVVAGTDETIYKASSVKGNLSVASQYSAGAKYDPKNVRFKTRDMTLHLHIKTSTIEEFWDKWDALFATLMQPDEREFYFNGNGNYYRCYYKSNSVSKFLLRDDMVWCDFTVALTCLDYQPITEWLLLAAEDNENRAFIITEDGARIRVRPRTGLAMLITQDGEFVTTEDGNYYICINNT